MRELNVPEDSAPPLFIALRSTLARESSPLAASWESLLLSTSLASMHISCSLFTGTSSEEESEEEEEFQRCAGDAAITDSGELPRSMRRTAPSFSRSAQIRRKRPFSWSDKRLDTGNLFLVKKNETSWERKRSRSRAWGMDLWNVNIWFAGIPGQTTRKQTVRLKGYFGQFRSSKT